MPGYGSRALQTRGVRRRGDEPGPDARPTPSVGRNSGGSLHQLSGSSSTLGSELGALPHPPVEWSGPVDRVAHVAVVPLSAALPLPEVLERPLGVAESGTGGGREDCQG